MVDSLTKEGAADFMGKVALIAWNIWKVRNNFVFRHSKVKSGDHSGSKINHGSLEFSKLSVRSSVQMDNPIDEEATTTWRAPDFGKFKVNCDVASYSS